MLPTLKIQTTLPKTTFLEGNQQAQHAKSCAVCLKRWVLSKRRPIANIHDCHVKTTHLAHQHGL